MTPKKNEKQKNTGNRHRAMESPKNGSSGNSDKAADVTHTNEETEEETKEMGVDAEVNEEGSSAETESFVADEENNEATSESEQPVSSTEEQAPSAESEIVRFKVKPGYVYLLNGRRTWWPHQEGQDTRENVAGQAHKVEIL